MWAWGLVRPSVGKSTCCAGQRHEGPLDCLAASLAPDSVRQPVLRVKSDGAGHLLSSERAQHMPAQVDMPYPPQVNTHTTGWEGVGFNQVPILDLANFWVA